MFQNTNTATAGTAITGASARSENGIARVVVVLFDTVAEWAERRRQRRALEALPDHLLHDIGLSRADAVNEADKPFWRG